MNLGQSIRKGVKWLLVGNMGGQVLQFAFGVFLARLLVPADFGMMATLQVFTGFVGMLATGGMGQSLIRAKEVEAEDFNAIFTLQLLLGFLIYTGFFVCAPWVGEYFDNPLYTDLLRVSALSFLLRPFTLTRISWLNREMDFKKRSLVELTGGIVIGFASVLMAAAGMGVWSLALSGLVGAILGNLLLARVTPLHLRLNFHIATVAKHSGYGLKVTAGEIVKHLKEQSINLILSKLAGPAFLGLYNKAESLARMPNRLVTPPTSQAVFRAMSKAQDDLDQTKYMYYRTITLLMVYVSPFLVGLLWIAEPFVGVVYGKKWLPAVEPLRIIVLAGFLRNIFIPSSVVLAAQNRLTQEVAAEAVSLVIGVGACLIGLRWGLKGVAWGLVVTVALFTTHLYILVYRVLPTRIADLVKAVAPGLLLNTILLGVLIIVHLLLADLREGRPLLYLAAMVLAGSIAYASAFLLVPIPALRSETTRWKQSVRGGLALASRTLALTKSRTDRR